MIPIVDAENSKGSREGGLLEHRVLVTVELKYAEEAVYTAGTIGNGNAGTHRAIRSNAKLQSGNAPKTLTSTRLHSSSAKPNVVPSTHAGVC
jgi:hypothetical protein